MKRYMVIEIWWWCSRIAADTTALYFSPFRFFCSKCLMKVLFFERLQKRRSLTRTPKRWATIQIKYHQHSTFNIQQHGLFAIAAGVKWRIKESNASHLFSVYFVWFFFSKEKKKNRKWCRNNGRQTAKVKNFRHDRFLFRFAWFSVYPAVEKNSMSGWRLWNTANSIDETKRCGGVWFCQFFGNATHCIFGNWFIFGARPLLCFPFFALHSKTFKVFHRIALNDNQNQTLPPISCPLLVFKVHEK